MKKIKVAISLDKDLLDKIDSKVDREILRSRSQAMEFYLRKGLKDEKVETAVLLVSKKNQEKLLKKSNGICLLEKQVKFFRDSGINKIMILTQHRHSINDLISKADEIGRDITIIRSSAKNNGEALLIANEKIKENNFVVMNGNIFLEFDLTGMIMRHIKEDKLATIGLMSAKETSRFGVAKLDGEMVVDFIEKPKSIDTFIVNAGIYVLKKEVFELMGKKQIEIDLIPKLAKIKQLLGFFTYGKYEYY